MKRFFYKIIRNVIFKAFSEKYGSTDFYRLRDLFFNVYSEKYGLDDYQRLRNLFFTIFSEKYGIEDYRTLRKLLLDIFSNKYAVEDYPLMAGMLHEIIPLLHDSSIMSKKVLEAFPEINMLKSSGSHLFTDNSTKVKKGCNVKVYSPYHLTDVQVGDYTYIAQNSYISMTSIGKFCSIGPNLLCGWGIHPLNGISTHPMFFSTLRQNGMTLSQEDKFEERKHITIGNDVFIGANVTILDGVTIGDGAVIGAGAVVSKDIPSYSVAVGCPIKIIKYRFAKELCEKLKKIKWWDFDAEHLQDVEKSIFNVGEFVEKLS